jgi:hypothetical protein
MIAHPTPEYVGISVISISRISVVITALSIGPAVGASLSPRMLQALIAGW